MDRLAIETPMEPQRIAALIDASPMNRGAVGASWIADPDNQFKVVGGCVMLFERNLDTMNFHWLVTAGGARNIIRSTREAFKEILSDPEISVIYGMIPQNRPDSALMARWVGAKLSHSTDTEDGPCDVYYAPKRAFLELS